MLTQKMIRVITLLKQIDGFPQVLCAEDAVLLDDFCRAGLVHRMGDNESTSCRYALIKPLRQINLCDVLRIVGGEVLLSLDDEKEIYECYGSAGRRLGVINYMTCRFLSDINLAEVVLPDSSLGERNEEQKNK